MTWALRQADRRRLVTLTLLPADFQEARHQVRDWVYRVRRSGCAWEWSWAIEENPRGTGYHAHGVQHGGYLDQAHGERLWGGRVMDIRALKTPGAGVYAVKEALRVTGYTMKGATSSSEALRAHLDRNGGRVAHWSRGFLHGLTKRDVLSRVREELAGEKERLTWVLVPAGASAPLRAVETASTA